MTAFIHRTKVYPTPGTNYRVAWKWLYDVSGLGVTLSGFDRLASARQAAKRHGATAIVLTWDSPSKGERL